MKEQPEKKQGGKEKIESLKDALKRTIENFLSRSDEPGKFLSDEEKFEMIEKAKSDPKAFEEWEKHKKGSKYRKNSLGTPLTAGLIFLDSEFALALPLGKRKELLERVNRARKRVIEGYGKPYTAEDVQEVIDIANELKKYL